MVDIGDEVRRDTDVLEIETDKATVCVPSTGKGIVVRLYVQPGAIFGIWATDSPGSTKSKLSRFAS